jgi:hypothetical protein
MPYINFNKILNVRLLSNRTLKVFQVIALLLFPIYFIFPMINSHFTVCPFFLITGIPCPGCGLGRSLISIFHLDFVKALYYNPFGYCIAPIQMYLAISLFFPSMNDFYYRQYRKIVWIQYSLGCLFILYGYVRIYSFFQTDSILTKYFFDFTK